MQQHHYTSFAASKGLVLLFRQELCHQRKRDEITIPLAVSNNVTFRLAFYLPCVIPCLFQLNYRMFLLIHLLRFFSFFDATSKVPE